MFENVHVSACSCSAASYQSLLPLLLTYPSLFPEVRTEITNGLWSVPFLLVVLVYEVRNTARFNIRPTATSSFPSSLQFFWSRLPFYDATVVCIILQH